MCLLELSIKVIDLVRSAQLQAPLLLEREGDTSKTNDCFKMCSTRERVRLDVSGGWRASGRALLPCVLEWGGAGCQGFHVVPCWLGAHCLHVCVCVCVYVGGGCGAAGC